MIAMFDEIRSVHFVGIGGSGSDVSRSGILGRLHTAVRWFIFWWLQPGV